MRGPGRSVVTSFAGALAAGIFLARVRTGRHPMVEAGQPGQVVSGPPGSSPGAAPERRAALTAAPQPSTIAAPGPVERDVSQQGPAVDPSFRPDVEGLRGVAILLVVLFHGAFPVPGGFVGVDVFFVISGFLITGLLVREIGRTGTIALDRFYARRIRRLLPAAAVALAVTLPLSYAILAPLDRAQAMDDGLASILSVANIRFALADGDYFASVTGPSPFLHFWSLALEEQFYLFWPLLLLAVARGRRPRVRTGLTLAILIAASFAIGVALTDASATWAFYALPSRAWQFAAGGLVAIGAGVVARIPTPALIAAGWSGAVLLVVSALALDGSLPYPGILAAAPTLAAVYLIASGDRRYGPGRLLGTAPLRFLGRISYSLYLWHWPILTLPAIALGTTLEPAAVLSLVGVAVVVAWLSERTVEQRFRRPWPTARSDARRSLAVGAVAMAAVVVLAGSLDLAASGTVSDGSEGTDAAIALDAPIMTLDAGPATRAGDGTDPTFDAIAGLTPPSAAPSGSRAPAAGSASALTTDQPSASPGPSTVPAEVAARAPGWTLAIPVDAPERSIPLPHDVHPSLADVRGDIERLFADGCITSTSGTRPSRCVYGDEDGRVAIALVGDSHASHWFPAFNVLANRHGWRLLPFVKVACPFVDMPVRNLLIKRTYTECETWRARVIAAVNRERPDLVVVVSGYRAIIATRTADASPKRQGAAMARAIAKLSAPVAVMIDSPRASFDIPACLSRHRDDVRDCAIPRKEAFPSQFGLRERIAAAATGAGLLDLVAAVCPATPCQVVRDGHILYRDGHHLTATFVRSLAGDLDRALGPFLVRTPTGDEASQPAPTSQVRATGPGPVASGPAVLVPPVSSPAPTESPAVVAAVLVPPASDPAPSAPDRTTPNADVQFEAAAGRAVDGHDPAGSGSLEPIVATHPTNPALLAIAYTRASGNGTGSGAALSIGVRVSRDGGHTWRETRRHPWDGSGRRPSLHSAIAWGPGPSGTSRLYWTGTTTGKDGVRVAIAHSDDLGASWSQLRVARGTPAWSGGFPDVTVDRDPASPGYGVVYVAYAYPARSGRGAAIRLLASTDFGRTWHGTDVERAPVTRPYSVSWRFGCRVRTTPDGAVIVSVYQADLRSWNGADVFDRGGASNVGRIGFAVTRLTVDRSTGTLTASPTVMATTIARNAYTTSRRTAPGTRSHTYLDPIWSHGLDVDRSTGRLYLAVADVATRPAKGEPRGTVRVGRSDDGGASWAWVTLPAAPPITGRLQSSFRPTIAVRNSVVLVGLHTIDDVASSNSSRTDARIGNAVAVSYDGGRSFPVPSLVSGKRWRASSLERTANGPGLRDRAEVAADGRIVYAYGDGRIAAAAPARSAGRRQIFVAMIAVQRSELLPRSGR